jgi:hypothetical protein
MATILIGITLGLVALADWSTVPADTYTYPETNEFFGKCTVTNQTFYPVPYSVESHSHGFQSECEGSQSALPPWNSYFAALFVTSHTWSGTSGPGILPANTARFYKLRITTNGGQEKWVSVNPVQGPYSRYRNDRTAYFFYVDESLDQDPGEGGSG